MNASKFESLVEQYSSMVLKVAMANTNNIDDAKDITQEVFIKLYKQNHFIDDDHIKYWLIRVTINQSRSLHRLFHRKHDVEFDESFAVPTKQNKSIHYELSLLKREERIYVYLHYIEGYTFKEIGEITNISPNTVASKIRRALVKLRRIMEETHE